MFKPNYSELCVKRTLCAKEKTVIVHRSMNFEPFATRPYLTSGPICLGFMANIVNYDLLREKGEIIERNISKEFHI